MSQQVYSQHEEQHIIQSLLERYQITPVAVEIGINNGAKGDGATLQGNTVFLKSQGWTCVWIDRDTHHRDVITKTVYPENVTSIIADHLHDSQIGIFSIDIDSEDWYVVQAVLRDKIFPDMFVCETNSYLDPMEDLVMPLNHRRQGMAKSICHGATLRAFDNLMKKFDYNFHSTTGLGNNGFWLRSDIMDTSSAVSAFGGNRHPLTTNWSKSLPTDRWLSSEMLLD